MRKIIYSKSEVLRNFAKRIPNAQSIAIDFGRDNLTVFFDNIHSKEYKASEILNRFIEGMAKSGVQIVWE